MKYNSDGDLLFTTSKDNKPTVWYSDSGERLGTYSTLLDVSMFSFLYLIDVLCAGGHKGAVWDIDPSWDSQFVLTAGADGTARLYETTTGSNIARMPHKGYGRHDAAACAVLTRAPYFALQSCSLR